jgi:anti-sigma B factor antagonist
MRDVARRRRRPAIRSAATLAPRMQPMPMANWNIDVIDDGTTLLVIPFGELDVHTTPQLTRALERCTNAHKVLIVDVTGLSFIDSTGLGALLAARDRVRDRLLLAGANPVVDRLLELTSTAGLFQRSAS